MSQVPMGPTGPGPNAKLTPSVTKHAGGCFPCSAGILPALLQGQKRRTFLPLSRQQQHSTATGPIRYHFFRMQFGGFTFCRRDFLDLGGWIRPTAGEAVENGTGGQNLKRCERARPWRDAAFNTFLPTVGLRERTGRRRSSI